MSGNDEVPDYPPEFFALKASYSSVSIEADGPVAQWANELCETYGHTWSSIVEWRWVDGEVPFAQFVCIRADGGRDWLTITYAKKPPTLIDENPNTVY